MIKCKQCGEIRTETEFRKYYGSGNRGRYKVCKQCESINNRHKYLRRKETLSEAEEIEKQEIEHLYDLLRAEGLQPPATKAVSTVRDTVKDLIQRRQEKADQIAATVEGVSIATPPAILEWFSKDLSAYEEWELQEIFDELEEAYRPEIGVDPNTFKPIFDETHKEVLDKLEEHLGLV